MRGLPGATGTSPLTTAATWVFAARGHCPLEADLTPVGPLASRRGTCEPGRNAQHADVARSVIGAKRSCVPTMRYAANRAWQLLSVLAFTLMVVSARDTARGATRKRRSRFPFRDHPHAALPSLCTVPCRSPRPFSATLGIDGKRADRQETESVNGPTNPPARDRSLVRGLHSQAYGGAVFLVGGLLLAAMGRLPPGVAGRTG